jgi:ATP:corrinoid adenosyltransferase
MSKAMDYWETHDHRTIEDIKSCALKSVFSCQHQPLLDIKLENVVLDELHLMLRITGIIK